MHALRSTVGATLALAAIGLALPAAAHVTLQVQEARAGSTYRAVLQVPHGCEGAATTALRVKIPEGMIAVKPMPKPGWELATKIEKYPAPVKYYESTLTEGVSEITWSGGKLPDDWYDEFVFRGKLPEGAAGSMVWFPVVQECGSDATRWIQIPADGKKADDYEHPAPGLKLLGK
jgi:uncharacterized protein YcnI